MNRHTLLVSASVVVGCLVLGLFLSPATVGQQPAALPSKVGKYQLALGIDIQGKQALFMCDTETGQVWHYHPTGGVVLAPKATWAETVSPVKK